MLAVERLVCECFGAGVPEKIANIIKLIYNGVRIAVPIILILVGMVDMGRAITKHDESEIKKAQQLLIRKAVAAGLVFLILSIVMLLLSIVDDNYDEDVGCISCILAPSEERKAVTTNDVKLKKVESLSFSANEIAINPGASKEVYVYVNPADASNKSLIFNNTNDSVASFKVEQLSQAFKITITGLNEGTTTYTAISNSNNLARASVIVKVSSNKILALNKTNIFLDGSKKSSEQLDSGLTGVTWSSSDTTVATVDKSGNVTAQGFGKATVTAKYNNQETNAVIHVIGINTTNTIRSVEVNASSKLNATIEGAAGDSEALKIKWNLISGKEYLSIDENDGNVKGLKNGTAKVRATVYTASGQTNIYKEVYIKVGNDREPKFKMVSSHTIPIYQSIVISLGNITNNECNSVSISKPASTIFVDPNEYIEIANKKFSVGSKTSENICMISIRGKKVIQNLSFKLNVGEGISIDLGGDFSVVKTPFFLDSITVYSNDLDKTIYLNLLQNESRPIGCNNCAISFISANQLKVKFGGIDYVMKINSSNVVFENSKDNVKIKGISPGGGTIDIYVNNEIVNIIDYQVFADSKICTGKNEKANNLIPFKYSYLYRVTGNGSTTLIWAFAKENYRLDFILQGDAQKEYKSCSNLLLEFRAQDGDKAYLFRGRLDGIMPNCYLDIDYTTFLGSNCNGAKKAYLQSINLYYVKN